MEKIEILYETFNSAEFLAKQEQSLLESALKAAQKAYAPYSGFKVGAVVLLNNGIVVTGNNQENAAYPSGLCAERVALFSAGATYPNAAILALAVTAIKGGKQVASPVPPCGSCRQVFIEYETRQNQPFIVIMAGTDKIIRIPRSGMLLPFSFDADSL